MCTPKENAERRKQWENKKNAYRHLYLMKLGEENDYRLAGTDIVKAECEESMKRTIDDECLEEVEVM